MDLEQVIADLREIGSLIGLRTEDELMNFVRTELDWEERERKRREKAKREEEEEERLEIEHDHIMSLIHLGINYRKNSVGSLQLMEILKREQKIGISLRYESEQLRNSALLALNEKEIEHREENISSLSSRAKQLCDKDFRFKGEGEAEMRDLTFEIRKLKKERLVLMERKESLELEWLWTEIETESKIAGESEGTVDKLRQEGQAVNFDLPRSNTASVETDTQKLVALPNTADELDSLIGNKNKCFDETITVQLANQFTETVSAPKLDLETETRKDTVVKDLITRVEFGQTHTPPCTCDTLVDGLNAHDKIETDSIGCVPLRCDETSSNTVTDFSDRTNMHEKIETDSISCVSLKGSDTSTEFTDRTVSLRENVLATKTDIGRSRSPMIDVSHDVILEHKIIALCEVSSANTLTARETEVFDPDDSIGSNTDGDNVPMINSFTSDDMTVVRTETEFFSKRDMEEDRVKNCTGTKSSISGVLARDGR